MPVVNTIPFPQPTNASWLDPLPHCNAAQVLSFLRGVNLARLRDPDGTLSSFTSDIDAIYIPEATQAAVRAMRTNWDWSREIWFCDGTGTQSITLPRKNIVYVNMCLLRLLPSQIWYRFVRFRNVDGSEFGRNAAVDPNDFTEPAQTPPSSTLPYGDANTPYPQQPTFTGIEDADLFVDPRRRTLSIPPRVLAANVATPFFNYSFFKGVKNVEVHYAYGCPPTKYLDGSPLTYDPDTGIVNPTSGALGPDAPGGAAIDWSSGMPAGLTTTVARLAAANALRTISRSISQGLGSISVDGASESYNPKAFDVDDMESRAMKALVPYGIVSL
jgi:hypothetical protein